MWYSLVAARVDVCRRIIKARWRRFLLSHAEDPFHGENARLMPTIVCATKARVQACVRAAARTRSESRTEPLGLPRPASPPCCLKRRSSDSNQLAPRDLLGLPSAALPLRHLARGRLGEEVGAGQLG